MDGCGRVKGSGSWQDNTKENHFFVNPATKGTRKMASRASRDEERGCHPSNPLLQYLHHQ